MKVTVAEEEEEGGRRKEEIDLGSTWDLFGLRRGLSPNSVRSIRFELWYRYKQKAVRAVFKQRLDLRLIWYESGKVGPPPCPMSRIAIYIRVLACNWNRRSEVFSAQPQGRKTGGCLSQGEKKKEAKEGERAKAQQKGKVG